jgi:hypothetical protein
VTRDNNDYDDNNNATTAAATTTTTKTIIIIIYLPLWYYSQTCTFTSLMDFSHPALFFDLSSSF